MPILIATQTFKFNWTVFWKVRSCAIKAMLSGPKFGYHMRGGGEGAKGRFPTMKYGTFRYDTFEVENGLTKVLDK